MDPHALVDLLQTVVPLFAGFWMVLLAYQIVGHKPGKNIKADAWFAKYGWVYKIGGVSLIVGSLIKMAFRL